MKKSKIIIAILLTIILLPAFSACLAEGKQDSETATKDKNDNNVVELKEKLFVAKLNDIYLNKDEYLGKTIKFEGLRRTNHALFVEIAYIKRKSRQ